jgi:hypothetical protein
MDFGRRYLFLYLTISIAPALFAGASNGFEGKWVLDKNKTHATGAPEDLQLEMKQNGPNLTIKSKYREPKSAVYPLLWVGIMTYELDLTTDGTEKVNQIGPFAHNSRTRIEGNKMITEFVASDGPGKVDGQWIRTLSPDGKEMSLQVLASASDGRKLDQTLVFRRK